MKLYDELVARGLIAQVTNEEEIREMIDNGKATFYIGFDPTADSLHVGHFMALCLMKRLQMAGNRPIALIGGGTGMVGDPSGRSDMRTMMTPETIQHNCDCFKKQMERFIEFGEGKAMMVNNADWLMNLNYVELLREVGACFSVNNMLRAECYKQRMEKGLSFLEFNYMIMQSYDFYYLFQHYNCNMQFGGNDQWSNMLGGTELIRRKLGQDAHAMTITLLLNSEGKKMGKTAAGAVWLDPNKTSPYDFYQYWRNVEDADVLKCIRMLTFLPLEQIDEMDSWEGSQLNRAKEILAYELTALVHGKEEADKAQAAAKALFAGGGDRSSMPTTTLCQGDFCEGNGWHYTFFVPQHPEGLIALMGGDAPFIAKLDSLFTAEGEMGAEASPDISGLIGMYAHGNEPSHHVTYLYSYAGEPWKTAEKVRFIQDEFYTDQPEGVIGNEDCGQMSAWHVMSAMGFYQVNPSNGVYVFGSPLFPKATIHLPEGKTFEIVAQNNNKENIYIQSVTLNGQPYEKSYILYEDIMKGGNLTFVMGNTPNKAFGAAPENRPKTAE